MRDFDRRVFPAADLFPATLWRECDVYWMVLEGRRVGCSALQAEGDALYISSSGILPAVQGQGLGRLMKAWQLAYAKRNGFKRIVTNVRAGNKRMIALNRSFGFRIVRKMREFYCDPDEAGVEMELLL